MMNTRFKGIIPINKMYFRIESTGTKWNEIKYMS